MRLIMGVSGLFKVIKTPALTVAFKDACIAIWC